MACGKRVDLLADNLWSRLHDREICAAIRRDLSCPRLWMPASRFPSLVCRRQVRRMVARPHIPGAAIIMATGIHRFERIIGGHTYIIEAALVHADRWRAQIARRPGVPSALMPFYGTTPDEAALLLTRWLALAHRVAPDTIK
jgi:hypothetical protein